MQLNYAVADADDLVTFAGDIAPRHRGICSASASELNATAPRSLQVISPLVKTCYMQL